MSYTLEILLEVRKYIQGVTCLLQHKQCGGVDKNKQAIKN